MDSSGLSRSILFHQFITSHHRTYVHEMMESRNYVKISSL